MNENEKYQNCAVFRYIVAGFQLIKACMAVFVVAITAMKISNSTRTVDFMNGNEKSLNSVVLL